MKCKSNGPAATRISSQTRKPTRHIPSRKAERYSQPALSNADMAIIQPAVPYFGRFSARRFACLLLACYAFSDPEFAGLQAGPHGVIVGEKLNNYNIHQSAETQPNGLNLDQPHVSQVLNRPV